MKKRFLSMLLALCLVAGSMAAFAENVLPEGIDIPESVETVWWLAFYQCTGLTDVTVRNPDCTIYDDARTIPENAVIHGFTGSTAEAYAQQYERTFEVLVP